MLEARHLQGPHFRAVDLRVDTGQILCIHGPSGAGKSQLLRALADLDPHEGDICLHGQAQADFSPADWRRRVGLLPAEPPWWADSVAEHFRHPGDCFGLSDLGFSEQVMEWPVGRLSSGERQRLGLLRLLDAGPEVLLLDEPTANLDAANTRRMEALIRQYLDDRQAGAVWLSHDPAQWERIADQRLEMGGE